MKSLNPSTTLKSLKKILTNYTSTLPLNAHPESSNISNLLNNFSLIPDEYNNTKDYFQLFLYHLNYNYLTIAEPSILAIENLFESVKNKLYKIPNYWLTYLLFRKTLIIYKDTKTLNTKLINITKLTNNTNKNYFNEQILYKKLEIAQQKKIYRQILKIFNFLSIYNFEMKVEVLNKIRNLPDIKNNNILQKQEEYKIIYNEINEYEYNEFLYSSNSEISDEKLYFKTDNNINNNIKSNIKKSNFKLKKLDAKKIIATQNYTRTITPPSSPDLIYKNLALKEIKRLGQGGSGKVYLVYFDANYKQNYKTIVSNPEKFSETFMHCINSNKLEPLKFALKIVYCDKDDEHYKAVTNEISILKNLYNNKSIVNMYDYCIEERRICILMECGTIDLDKFMKEKVALKTKLGKKFDELKFNTIGDSINYLTDIDTNSNIKIELNNQNVNFNNINNNNKNCKTECNYFYPFTPNCHRLDYIGYLSPSNIKYLFSSLLDALKTLNSSYIIHRDIKSKNFVFFNENINTVSNTISNTNNNTISNTNNINNNNILKLIDFGLSRTVSENHTKHSTIHNAGTAGFMSPESINDKTLSRKSDIYSLGIILTDLVYASNYQSNNFYRNNFNKKQNFGFCKENCECRKNYNDIINNKQLNNKQMPELKLCEEHKSKIELRRYMDFFKIIERCCEYEREDRISLDELLDFEYTYY